MRTVDKWRAFWSDQKSPLWNSDTPEFYQVYAKELKVLFGDSSAARVLEIGCGNGAMFEFLGFDQVQYKGVDFSPRLLAAFKSKHPDVELECCEGSSYVDRENKYDLIFSNGVIQYFDMPMVQSHFACARFMMHGDALFVCGGIPWRLRRSDYESGGLAGTMVPSALKSAKAKTARALFGDPMGYWYNLHEIAALANKHGLGVKLYGSMTNLYRFHAVMRLK